MKTEKTYLDVLVFRATAFEYLKKNSEKEETKLVKCIKNIVKQTEKIFIDYQDLAEDINIEHCLVDENTKKILKDASGGYEYSKEGLKARKLAFKDLNQTKVVLHSRILPENDLEKLTDEEKEVFSDIVITKIKDEEI